MEIALVLGLLVLAVILFITEKFSVDVVTIGMLLVLVLAGILQPHEAFAGFSSDFIVILASIFVLTGALSETGLLDKAGSMMVQVVSRSQTLFMAYMMLITGFLSAFMNNTTVTALLIGPVIGMSRSLKISPSKMLLPIAFASILGGTCTLIGTSTNVAVSGYIEQVGMEPLRFFEILKIGIILSVTGIIFMLIFGRWLLPDHKPVSFTEGYEIRQYLSEIVVTESSKLIGQRAFESDLSARDIRIVKIIRDEEEMIPFRSTLIMPNDILLVECRLDDLMKIKETSGLEILADVITDKELQTDKIKLAEVLITPGSFLKNKTLKQTRFRQNYDLVVLAIHRFNENLANKIANLRLKTGDLLLVQGTEDSINAIRNSNEMTVLGDFRVNMFKERKGIFSACFFLAAVVLGSMNVIPLSIAFLAAGLLTVMVGAITPEHVYRIIDWRLLILIGGMSAFGTAMEHSGASLFLAEMITNLFRDMGELYVLGAFVILVIFLTQPMSNAAAALVVLPVALEAAELLGANPRSFAIAIMLGASVSLITPFEPSCILVYGPGRYKFVDFIKAGLPLTIILVILILILVPRFWPI